MEAKRAFYGGMKLDLRLSFLEVRMLRQVLKEAGSHLSLHTGAYTLIQTLMAALDPEAPREMTDCCEEGE